MHKSFFQLKISVFLLLCTALLAGCSNKLGYGVVNWSVPEYGLDAGDIIPVYVRSNIEKLYIVGLNEQTEMRIEIPLWQLTFFESKREAVKFQKKLEEYRYTYAFVKLDGLPMRIAPDNTAKQVYKLREDQTVKILWFGDGVPVLKNGKPMEGQWFEVLTDDGARGWCFSYNLTIYDERDKRAVAESGTGEIQDEELEKILLETWYPAHYRRMINDRQIDLDKVSLTWGFFPGARSKIARIELEGVQLSFPYTKITKINGKYRFDGSNLSMQIRGKDSISVEFSDLSGKQRIENFASLSTTAEEIIDSELTRREKKIAEIAGTAKEFSSENFGTLKILQDGQFFWNGYNLISPSIIPDAAGASGTVSIKYFLSKRFLSDYDGVLSFKFEKSSEPIIFMYNISSSGLRLEAVEPANIKENTVERRSLNPVILFFAAK